MFVVLGGYAGLTRGWDGIINDSSIGVAPGKGTSEICSWSLRNQANGGIMH